MGEEKKEVIAAFDFDGTITTKDTLFDFISYYYGKVRLIAGLIILSPVLILFKIGIIKNYKAKQIMFSFFFKSKKIQDFNNICNSYSQRINEICRDSTLEKIRQHREQGHQVIIISASISNWIKPWAQEHGIELVLGTEIEVEGGTISGKFRSKNCYGQEKVNRLIELYPDRNNYTLYAYGDSRGDKELLELSDYPTLIK